MNHVEKNGENVIFYVGLLPTLSLDSNLPFSGICLELFVPKFIQDVQYVWYSYFPDIHSLTLSEAMYQWIFYFAYLSFFPFWFTVS